MVYHASCDFCPSSKRVHYLHKRIGSHLKHISLVAWIFKITGVLCVTIINFYIFKWLFLDSDFFVERVQNLFVPHFAILVFSFIVSSLIIGVYSTACDALLIGYLIDLDHGLASRVPELGVLLESNRYKPLLPN